MKKPTVAFRNIAKAPKTYATYSGSGSFFGQLGTVFPLPVSTPVVKTSHDILDDNDNSNNVYNYNVNREYDVFPRGKESFVSHSAECWKSPRSGLDISGA